MGPRLPSRVYEPAGTAKASLAGSQTVAFTATADAATRSDILSRLFPAPPQVFVHGFDRPNLRLAMSPRSGGRSQIAQFVAAHRGDSGIVYCGSRAPYRRARRCSPRAKESRRCPIMPAWTPPTARATRTSSCRRTAS